jgi:hypothetical protein
MAADVVKFEDAAATFDRDRRVFRLRLAGTSVRKIAEQLKCTPDEVNASIVRMTGGVSPDLRARTIQLELERLDEMQQGFYLDSLTTNERKGNFDSAVIVLRIMERRARLLGLDVPVRHDAPLDDMAGRQTSTDRIRSVIDRLTGKTDRTIDGEIVKGEEGGGGG